MCSRKGTCAAVALVILSRGISNSGLAEWTTAVRILAEVRVSLFITTSTPTQGVHPVYEICAGGSLVGSKVVSKLGMSGTLHYIHFAIRLQHMFHSHREHYYYYCCLYFYLI